MVIPVFLRRGGSGISLILSFRFISLEAFFTASLGIELYLQILNGFVQMAANSYPGPHRKCYCGVKAMNYETQGRMLHGDGGCWSLTKSAFQQLRRAAPSVHSWSPRSHLLHTEYELIRINRDVSVFSAFTKNPCSCWPAFPSPPHGNLLFVRSSPCGLSNMYFKGNVL